MMKKKLLALELPNNVVDEILDVYSIYLQTLEAYSKPAGPKAFKNNIEEIESVCKDLSKKLNQLTDFERQMLEYNGAVNIRELAKKVHFLSSCCGFTKQKDIKSCFNRKEPFLRQLALEVKEALEHHNIPVKKYRNNVFCSVLDILLNQKAGEKSFNLLRQVCEKHS